jgi:hypothetical protein
MNWMTELLEQLEGMFVTVNYRGYDIVPDAIRAHRRRFAHKPNYRFYNADLVSTVPVEGDILLCRDMINHLSLADGRRVLSNLLLSRTPLLLVSSDQRENVRRNEPLGGLEAADESAGRSRAVDLSRPPFSWPRAASGNGHLWLWKMRPIRHHRRRLLRDPRAREL